MSDITAEINRNIKHLRLLAERYPTIQSVYTEIINLRAILVLPKGTEHFLSDLHGEHEAFTHILNNCSGVIREKVDFLFADKLSEQERGELCTLIYYPEAKLRQLKDRLPNMDEWYQGILLRMVDVSRLIAGKYTRSKVRKAMDPDFAYIMDELLNADFVGANHAPYYNKILESILSLGDADAFIISLARLIKRLAVDRLHIVGDIFDRGPRPDIIMDMLERHHSIDIQWGNHDILWMGAAAGSEVCVAGVVTNAAAFGNLKLLEEGYGINLRPLALFAEKTYRETTPRFAPRPTGDINSERDAALSAKMYKAAAIMLFKLEGMVWLRNPAFGMHDRLVLGGLDPASGTVNIGGQVYPLTDTDFPTVEMDDPCRLTREEAEVMESLRSSFLHSERLQRHVRFLFSHGSVYRIHNQNLIYHGCVPMEGDGSYSEVALCGERASGKALLDLCDRAARSAYFGGKNRDEALDAMWYLWCGRRSPMFGRSRMTTFERLFIEDASAWAEEKNHYYNYIRSREHCFRIMADFGLETEISHIINGHVPVRAADGESPVKGGGRLIVIDGGFSRAYQPTTGIAGYTLIYNSYGMRLSAHRPFESVQKAVEENLDIHSATDVFETLSSRLLVMDTDAGQELSEQIYDLSLLHNAYRLGILRER